MVLLKFALWKVTHSFKEKAWKSNWGKLYFSKNLNAGSVSLYNGFARKLPIFFFLNVQARDWQRREWKIIKEFEDTFFPFESSVQSFNLFDVLPCQRN